MPNHERIDPRRGPGRERDDGRREIDAGVAEYEEDRDAERADEYDSREDWGFDWAEEMDDMEEGSPMTDPREDAYDDHEPDDDDVHVSARVQDGGIVIEIPVPANMAGQGLAEYVEEITRRIASDFLRAGGGKATERRTPGGHRIHDANSPESQDW